MSSTLGEGVTLKVLMSLSRSSSHSQLPYPGTVSATHSSQLPSCPCPAPTQAALYRLCSALAHLFPAFLYPKKLLSLMMICRRALSSLNPWCGALVHKHLCPINTVDTLQLELTFPVDVEVGSLLCSSLTPDTHSSDCPSLWVRSKGNCIVASKTQCVSLGPTFIMEACWRLLDVFSASVEMIM